LDENNLAGRDGLRYAAAKMPVIIMEPLRGGMLAVNLPKAAAKAFEQAPVKRSPAEWAIRWLCDQPEVACVLSGMNGMDMLKENIRTVSAAVPGEFTEGDLSVIAAAKKNIAETIKVPCTACGYCMPCPQGVDIPTCLFCYNDIAISGKMQALANYFTQTSLKSSPQNASHCNNCKWCEKRCPQKIEVAKEIKNTTQAFEKFWYKPLVSLVKRFMKL
jgi:hypothetical protein